MKTADDSSPVHKDRLFPTDLRVPRPGHGRLNLIYPCQRHAADNLPGSRILYFDKVSPF